jgi:hypothetical protein
MKAGTKFNLGAFLDGVTGAGLFGRLQRPARVRS